MSLRAKKTHTKAQLWIYALVAFFVLYADIFSLGTATDNASRQAFLKIVAPLYPFFAPNVTSDATTINAREKIFVITISDTDLPKLSDPPTTMWPMKYGDQARLLTKILETQPAAIFWDFYIPHINKADGSFQELKAVLEQTAHNFAKNNPDALSNTEIIFADGSFNNKRGTNLRASTTPTSQIADEIVFTGVTLVPATWLGEDHEYPLYINDVSRKSETSGTPEEGQQASLSAAHYLYRRLKPDAPIIEGAPLTVIWGDDTAPTYTARHREEQDCADTPGSFTSVMGLIAQAFGGPKNYQASWHSPNPCFYSNFFTADQFLELYNLENNIYSPTANMPARLKEKCRVNCDIFEMFKNSIVLVGGNLAGIADLRNSPVNDLTPGVLLHAAALDNLLTYGPDYYRSPPSYLGQRFDTSIILEIIFAVLALYFGHNVRNSALYQRCPVSYRFAYLLLVFSSYISLLFLVLIIGLSWGRFIPINWIAMITICLIAIAPRSETLAELLTSLWRKVSPFKRRL